MAVLTHRAWWAILLAGSLAPSDATSSANTTSSKDDSSVDTLDIFLTVLKYYGIITGIVIIMLGCASIPFLCQYCFKHEDEEVESVGHSDAPGMGENNSRRHFDLCREGPRILCATMFWPVLAVIALGTCLIDGAGALTSVARQWRNLVQDDVPLDNDPKSPRFPVTTRVSKDVCKMVVHDDECCV